MSSMKKTLRFSRLNQFLLLILLSLTAERAFASQPIRMISEPALVGESQKAAFERHALSDAKGLIMLDYEVIPIPGNPSLDLLGTHYLHQLTPWLYLGLGLYAPLVYGQYGGFMALGATIHAQQKVAGNAFVDAGASFGGGGGGSSVAKSKDLSGSGGFVKGYIGLGYDFGAFSAGVNYARLRFAHSLINHSQLDVFVQSPVSYTIGSYADSGNRIEPGDIPQEGGENMLSLELNNLFQIKPKGSSKGTINLLAMQFSHFLTRHQYLFIDGEVGYHGVPLSNIILGGMGYRLPVSPRVNLYGQMALGSGIYAPSRIDTGPGLLVYPKLSLEYLLNNKLGLALSGGYMFAPKGSSRNYTLAASMNLHLSSGARNLSGSGAAENMVLRGFRVSVFQQSEFDVRLGGAKQNDIHMLSTQLDYLLNQHWYIPMQASFAYTAYLGGPGYGEVFTGLGVQNAFSATDRFQGFLQVLIGPNAHGLVLKPSAGLNIALDDRLALYAQFGKIISVPQFHLYSNQRFSAYSAGLGLTYRFSLPDSALR